MREIRFFRKVSAELIYMGGDYETILKSVEKLRSMDRNYYVIPGHEDFFELKDHIL